MKLHFAKLHVLTALVLLSMVIVSSCSKPKSDDQPSKGKEKQFTNNIMTVFYVGHATMTPATVTITEGDRSAITALNGTTSRQWFVQYDQTATVITLKNTGGGELAHFNLAAPNGGVGRGDMVGNTDYHVLWNSDQSAIVIMDQNLSGAEGHGVSKPDTANKK